MQPAYHEKPISVVARGSRRPLIVVVELTRPTPAERVLPCPPSAGGGRDRRSGRLDPDGDRHA